jgi:hypothetical protein
LDDTWTPSWPNVLPTRHWIKCTNTLRAAQINHPIVDLLAERGK